MEKLKSILTNRRIWTVIGSIAVMAVIALIYFYPDDMQGNVLQQHDTRQGLANGHEAQVFAEQTGESTRWTNALFGGMPTFQISPSYPSNSLFTWIQSVLSLGLPYPASLIFLMMLGFFILLMTMRMKWYVSLIGAIAYGFSSYFIIIIGAGHIWKFVTLAFIPPTIAGLVLAYRGRYLSGAAITALFGMLQISSNHVQMTYYFLFVVIGMAIACLFTAIQEKALRRWLTATGALAIAAILAFTANLPSLYNTYEYSKETIRGGHSELTRQTDTDAGRNSSDGGLDRDYLTQYSYGASESFSLLIPNIKGGATNLPMKGTNKFLSLGELESAQQMSYEGEISPETAYYLQQLPQYFGEPEGTNGPVYVGALIVALFIVGCFIVRGPMKWVLLVLTMLSILLALGRNFMWLTDFMIDYIPLYNKFRTPESILVIAEFTIPLLAMMGLQKILSGNPVESWQRYGRAVTWSFIVVITLCLIGVIAPGTYGEGVTEMEKAAGINQMPALYQAVESLRYGMVRSDSLRSLIIVALGLGVLLLYFRKFISVGVAALGIAVVVIGDLFSINKRYLNSDCFMPAPLSNDEIFTVSPADEAILADTAMNYRVMDTQRFMSADPSYHHKAIGGYHAAKLTRYQDILDYYFLSGERDYSNVLNMLNTKYVIGDPKQQPMLNPDAKGNAWLVDRVRYVQSPDDEIAAIEDLDLNIEAVADSKFEPALGPSQMKSAGDTIFETSYAPNRLTYHATSSRGGVAVFSEVYFPWGWKATIDGKPAELARVNYILRALRIPAGGHTIELRFDPDSLKTTTTAAYIAILAIYTLLIAAGAISLSKYLTNNKKPKTTDIAD